VIRRLICVALALALGTGVGFAHELELRPQLLADATAQPESGVTANPGRPRQLPGQTLPLSPTRQIAFETDEGTWMSLDLSPDGSRIVFDLLGDLYTLDVNGGRAMPITRGMGFDTQPRIPRQPMDCVCQRSFGR
jgi:hypothetical protein